MSEVSAPVALNFACQLIGVPMIPGKDYYSIFLRITEAMDSGLDPKKQRPGVEATEELNEFITNSLPKAPPGSVIYELFQDPTVQQMPAGYVRLTISAMFNAAYSTAYASMGSFLKLALAEHDLTQKIMDCPSPDAAVEELLRLTSPAQATMRFAAQDICIRDVLIKRTDMVIGLMASANHDPERFPSPNEFDPNRHSIAHLSFGWGVHFCIGAMPARTFLRNYLTRLNQCVASLEPAEKPQWENTVTLRCLKTLPLKKRKRDQQTMAVLENSAIRVKG
jgi:cytochrome P450